MPADMPIVEFYLDESEKRRWRYRVIARNNEIVVASQGYVFLSSARRSVKRLFPQIPRENWLVLHPGELTK